MTEPFQVCVVFLMLTSLCCAGHTGDIQLYIHGVLMVFQRCFNGVPMVFGGLHDHYFIMWLVWTKLYYYCLPFILLVLWHFFCLPRFFLLDIKTVECITSKKTHFEVNASICQKPCQWSIKKKIRPCLLWPIMGDYATKTDYFGRVFYKVCWSFFSADSLSVGKWAWKRTLLTQKCRNVFVPLRQPNGTFLSPTLHISVVQRWSFQSV